MPSFPLRLAGYALVAGLALTAFCLAQRGVITIPPTCTFRHFVLC